MLFNMLLIPVEKFWFYFCQVITVVLIDCLCNYVALGDEWSLTELSEQKFLTSEMSREFRYHMLQLSFNVHI